MKKSLALLVTLALALSLAACSGRTDAPAVPVPSTAPETTVPESSSVPVPEMDYPLNTYTYTLTNNDGYEIEYTLRIGSWIKASDADTLTSAWESVGGKGSAPNVDSFNLGDKFNPFRNDRSVIVYGMLSLRNLTEGFDITPDSPLRTTVKIATENRLFNDFVNLGTWSVILDYSNERKVYGYDYEPSLQAVDFWVHMNEKTWEVPIAMAMANVFNPNNPDGNPLLSELEFSFWSERFYVEPLWASTQADSNQDAAPSQVANIRVGIGVEPNYPFLEMAGEGIMTGFEPDLYEALIAYLNPENTYLDVVSATDWSTKLSTGAIDAAICAITITNEPHESVDFTIPYVEYEGEQYVIAVRKGNTELRNALNAAIEALRKNGDLDDLTQKWFTDETPAASAQESEYEKLLNGDFSYFSGVWTNGEGVSFTLNKDGSIAEPSGSKSYPGDVTLMNGYYSWSSQHPNYGGTHVTLFPIGVADSYGLGSDASQVRIANGQSIPNSASELFVKTADLPSDANTQNTGGAFTEEQAIAYMTPLIITDWPQERLTEEFIASYADYTVAKSDKLYNDQPIYLIEYGVFRIGTGRALVFADGTVISREDPQFSNYNDYFDIDITAYWPFS